MDTSYKMPDISFDCKWMVLDHKNSMCYILQAKGKERQWLKHQTHGDLDEAKLIEGLTGERAIYRRRGEKEPEVFICVGP